MKLNLIKKKIVVTLLILFFLVNVVTAILIFADIQIISAPKTHVDIEILKVNKDNLLLKATLNMENPNDFQILLSDFVITSMTDDGKEIGNLLIEGGAINSNENETFIASEKIDFDGGSFVFLRNEITGVVGVKFLGFIKKEIPIELVVTTSMDEIIDNIKIPDIDVNVNFDALTSEGLEFSAVIDMYNPNTIGLEIKELSVVAITDEEVEVGSITITGGVIEPEGSSSFESEGKVFFESIDAEKLIFRLNSVVSVDIAGMKKTVSISTDNEVVIPDLTEFIFQNDFVEITIPVQFKLRLRGILSNVGFKITNPSDIPLLGENLICSIYRVDGEKMTLLGQEELQSCNISPESEVCVKTEILIPYRKFFLYGGFKPIPDWIVLNVDGNLSIAGTRQHVPLSLNAYVDPHLFRFKEATQLD